MNERNHSIFELVKKLPKPIRYGIYGSLITAGIAGAGAGVALGARAAISELRNSDDGSENLPKVEREITSRNFLELPFPPDPNVRIQQGWIREDGREHNGIDYILGTIDRSSTWQSFPILAAADGAACANPRSRQGNAVLIEHRVVGEDYETYYGHLKDGSIPPDIPSCLTPNKKPVLKGEQIGLAGSTGAENSRLIHLHFQVNGVDGRAPIDPYDLRAKRAEYPDPNFTSGKICGENHLWTNCPTTPVKLERSTPIPTPTIDSNQIELGPILNSEFIPTTEQDMTSSILLAIRNHPDVEKRKDIDIDSKLVVIIDLGDRIFLCVYGEMFQYPEDEERLTQDKIDDCTTLVISLLRIYQETGYQEFYQAALKVYNFFLTQLPNQKAEFDESLNHSSRFKPQFPLSP